MTDDDRARRSSLQRLRVLGLVGPILFVAALLCLRPVAVDRLDVDSAHVLVDAVLLVSAAGFGWAMYRGLGRAHEAAVRAEGRAAALLERDRIARELHDSIAQVLGVAHLRLRALAGRAGVRADERLRGEVDELATLCHESYRDVREAILGLKDADRPDRTLLEHLETYVSAFSRTSSIPTTLHAAADPDLGLTPDAEVQVIRVVQEALANVRKHSGASAASVHVVARRAETEFRVEDDGTGFDPGDGRRTGGFGLATMRERTESVDGRLLIDSAPGRGTRVVVRLPRAGRPAGASSAPADAPALRGAELGA